MSKDEKQEEIPIEENEELIVTTEEELQGFYIVRSFFAKYKGFNIERISYKDTFSYFGILADNNLRKWFCRLWFNGNKKYITIPTADKDKRIDLDTISDLYQHKQEIMVAFELKTNEKLV